MSESRERRKIVGSAVMETREAFRILDTQNAVTSGDKAEKAATLGLQNMVRQTLADITNVPQKPKHLIGDEKRQSIQITTKEYVEKLQKENMALVKMLVQRNKIIEQSGIELDRMRINLIKTREQNQQLALSNSQMLVELNSGKDRLKALQHELGCRNALLKARKLNEVSLNKLPDEGEFPKVVLGDEKPHKTKRRLRAQSLGSSQPSQSENAGNKRPYRRRQSARFETDDAPECPLSDEASHHQENAANKRPYTRRQSARFKADDPPKYPLSDEASQHQENAVNKRTCVRRQSARLKAVESNDVKSPNCPLADEPVLEKGSESQETGESVLEKGSQSQETGRPSRAAAKKVHSYREIPVNIKMRRSE